MTIFTKSKDPRPPVPKLCYRCRQRTGIARLLFVAAAGVRLGVNERESWICEECLDELRRGEQAN
jgi:hypothetical protein